MKYSLFILAIILVLLVTNVECWSKKTRDRSRDARERARQAKPERYNKRRQEQQQRQQQKDEPINVEIEDSPELKRINEELDKPIDAETGIPVEEQKKFNKELEDLEEQIKKQEDEDLKQEQQRRREERMSEIKANTERIRQEREKYQGEKLKLEEQKEAQRKEKIEELRKQREQNRINDPENQQQEDSELPPLTEEETKGLSKEEIIQLQKERQRNISDKNKPHFDDEQSMSEWLAEWEKSMKDFKADEMLSFEIPARGYEVFFEDVEKACTLRGAYFVNFDAKDGIDLKILDPRNKEVFKAVGKKQALFNFEATEIGTYSFYFQNRRSNDKKQTSFAVDVSDNDNHLQKQDVDDITNGFQDVRQQLRTQLSEYKILRRKDRSIDKERKGNATKIMIFSIIETVVIIGCTVFQVMYIKKILDNRSFV